MAADPLDFTVRPLQPPPKDGRVMDIGSAQWHARVIEGAQTLGLKISSRQVSMLAVHAREMLQWNRVTNLTSITRPLEIAAKHMIDSIAAADCIAPKSRILDVGSGAGFPGIPLKILDPSLMVTLVDSSRKRVSFLKHVIRTLHLEGIDAVHSRAQDLVHQGGAKAFDVIICRALTDVGSFVALALPLLAEGGKGIAMKGKAVEPEWANLSSGKLPEALAKEARSSGLVFRRVDYVLPYVDSKRVLVVFERDPSSLN